MDTGDKDNEGEEVGKEEQRTEGQYDTHTQRDEAGNSQGSMILWAFSPPSVGDVCACVYDRERERERERDKGET